MRRALTLATALAAIALTSACGTPEQLTAADRARIAENSRRVFSDLDRGTAGPSVGTVGSGAGSDSPRPEASSTPRPTTGSCAAGDLPPDFDVSAAAARLPDVVRGRMSGTRNMHLARTAATSRARTSLLRALYEAVYGCAPARVSGSISTAGIEIVMVPGDADMTAEIRLRPEDKLRLMQSFTGR
jgi:hypothetical protein